MTSKYLRLPRVALLLAAALLLCADYALAQGYGGSGSGNGSASSERRSAALAGRKAKTKKGGKAEITFPKSTRKEPEFKMSPKLGKKVQQGLDALNDEDYDKAEQLFNEIIAAPKVMASEKAASYQGLGNIAYERDEDSLKTVEYNVKALEIDALPNTSHFGLMQFNAQLYLQEDQFDNAIIWADRWMRETGEEKDSLLVVKGQANYQLEKYDLAAVAIKRAIEISAKPNESWYAVLMASYVEGEKYDEAIAYGESVLARDPNNKSIIKQLSNVFVESDQEPRAMALMERAYSGGLLTSESELRQLAQLYAYAEKPEQGAKIINDGLAKGVLKADLSTYSLLGEVYSQGDDHLKTAEAYGKAAQFAPDGDMKFRQAYALLDAEKTAEAKVAVLEALKKTPFKHEGESWVILGNIEIELNNKAAAIVAFEKAAKFPSTQKSAQSWLKNVRKM
ncbi:MAG: tetratricopeptide repeat protein [Pseudomonadota bacterium]|nr:tetratricopeptide repeat protein [Pseudomonadota bacterium]